MKDFEGKKVGVLGLGIENVALVKYLKGKNAKITICDQKEKEELGEFLSEIEDFDDIDYRLGSEYLEGLEDFEVIFRSPALPYFGEKIQAAQKAGVEVSSQTKLFFELCPSPIVGVTGTKGKGTTSSLIAGILKKSSQNKGNIYLSGNIGNAPIDFLDKLTADDIVVLELSSFQLQDLEKSSHIGVVLNITPDHLDYHKDFNEYSSSKENIIKFQNQEDFAVLNADYKTSSALVALGKGKKYYFSRFKDLDEGVFIEGDQIVLKKNDEKINIAKTNEVLLRGAHNLENINAAILASFLAGADIESITSTVKNFRGLEHRLEFFLSAGDIKFFNDSFSTTPETAIAAIKSFSEPVILIAGGSEKNADYSQLGNEIANSKVKTAILIGKTGPRIKSKINNTNLKIIDTCKSLDEVVQKVKEEAKPGDVVLLSPASASFDWFSNYKERGNQFKEKINAIF